MRSKTQFLAFLMTGFLIAGQVYGKNYIPENNETDGSKSTKSISAGCIQATASTELDLNNVRALIHTGGDMWWDLLGTARYEVPAGSGKHSLFAGTIWIGGTDVNGQLRLAGLMHRTYGVDYWPGPLITTGPERSNVTADVCTEFDKHFVITRDEVSRFRSWYNADEATRTEEFEGYSIPDIIQEWPAHGDVSNGYDYYLAPFMDVDGDAFYDPNAGDYPFYDLDGVVDCGTSREFRKVRLYGDKTLWWVYNDKGNLHTETGGSPIGMEVRAQSFAFSTNDELNNMTFGNYEIINRSTYTLENCYFGVWTDADLGDAFDDYVGCDVARGLGYLYNGDAIDGDGNGISYGAQPPAVGIDFFEGPYQDPDGKDNLSSWNPEGQLECNNGYARVNDAGEPDVNGDYQFVDIVDLNEGNINGLNFGDGRADNERWGMRRFLYFNNGSCPGMCDPRTAVQYYYYMRGFWKDGTPLQYGGSGHLSGGVTADFMFPGQPNTDPCGWGTDGSPQDDWSEETEGNPVDDRRFVQSAGPFTLEPGAVNDITIGVVWARAFKDNPYASVEDVRRADDKAQRLFENCFKVLDGPDAPELTGIELDREIIFHIWNKSESNNYREKYEAKDPFIVCPEEVPDCDLMYRFQGYQVYQLKDNTVSIADVTNPDLAREVFQCDVSDEVSQLINYEYSEEMNTNVPYEMVNGANSGILHTFRITNDLFASGDKRLINNKTYYFIAIAYAYNNYLAYDQDPTTDLATLNGQKKPYIAGRKGVGQSIKSIAVSPHKIMPRNNGTVLNSDYGDGVEITRLEGLGNGNNYLMLTEETTEEILSGPPWKASSLTYMQGFGPVDIKVVDPLNVVEDDYIIQLDTTSPGQVFGYGYVKGGKWFVYKASEADQLISAPVPGTGGEILDYVSFPESTVWADSTITFNNEQLILEWGISINLSQVNIPIERPTSAGSTENMVNNGFVGAYGEFADPSNAWLYGVPDNEGCDADDWIAVGTANDDDNPQCRDYVNSAAQYADENEVYENVLGGIWAPYMLCSKDNYGSNPRRNGVAYYASLPSIALAKTKYHRLSSVDIVITTDRSLWTRCPVIETCENDSLMDGTGDETPGPSQGSVLKFDMRRSPSIDKDGNFVSDTTAARSMNEEDANYISPVGMGWFPGYAIDVETGVRLNMAYGEDSWLGNDHGRDMLWNPTSRMYGELGGVLFGGKHFLYVFGNNAYSKKYVRNVVTGVIDTTYEPLYMPSYDAGEYMSTMLYRRKDTVSIIPGADVMKEGAWDKDYDDRKKFVWSNAMWASIPLTTGNFNFTSYDSIPTDVYIGLRMANSYWKPKPLWPSHVLDTIVDSVAQSINNNFPVFSFSTHGLAADTELKDSATSALDLIRVVPNPYYGHNSYEGSQLDYMVKITNLPQKCTISIYNVQGTLIRRFVKDSDDTFQDWNLKNEYGILISSGMYVIHVDGGEIGEKILKWFGSLRPMDMNAF